MMKTLGQCIRLPSAYKGLGSTEQKIRTLNPNVCRHCPGSGPAGELFRVG